MHKRPVRILCILCIFAAKCCSCLELTIFPDFFLIFRGFLLRKISFFPICKWNSTKSNNFTDRFWWSRHLKIKWEKIFWPFGVISRCLRPKLKKRFEGPQRTVLSLATSLKLSKLWNQLLTQILIYAQSYISFYVWNPCLVTTQCNRGYNHNIVLFWIMHILF